MPLTTLDPKTALVIIDLQKGIVAMPAVTPIDDVVKNTNVLLDAFHQYGLPVVLVNVANGAPGRTEQALRGANRQADWAELIPELHAKDSDLRVTKNSWGAFINTDLTAQLKDLGVTQIVLAGIATSIGIESTARQAYELGLNVTLATDAMTDRNIDTHTNSITKIFPRLGETGTTKEIIDVLSKRR